MADATAAAEVQDAAPKKKRAKLPLIIAAGAAAAIAAGGGAYFAFGGKKDAGAAEAKQVEAKHKAPKAPAVYVEFDPPFVVNFEAKGVMRFLQISVEVMTRDPATAELIRQHDPVLRNDLLLLLGNQSYEKISTREGKEALRQEALDVVARVIAAEGGDRKQVEQLYFTSFVMQ